MPKVYSVKSTGLNMPPIIKGTQGAKLQGGLPPVPWRSSMHKTGVANKRAYCPGMSRPA